MRVIVIARKELREDSLLLRALRPDGTVQNLKIPGVLKSKRRQAYFLTPGTKWEFEIAGPAKEVTVPRESTLLHSPFGDSVSYQELAAIAELLRPFQLVLEGGVPADLFELLGHSLDVWPTVSDAEKTNLTNYLCLRFMESMGLLNLSNECAISGEPLSMTDVYVASEGGVSQEALAANSEWKSEAIPIAWLSYYLKTYNAYAPATEDKFERSEIFSESATYRARLLEFFQAMH